jgi:hypothetical protein
VFCSRGDDNDKNNNYIKNNTYTPIYYLLNAFNNSLPNIKLKCTTSQETKNIIKSLKPKNTCGYFEILTTLLEISSVYIISPSNHIRNTSLSKGMFPQCLKYSVEKLSHSHVSNW